MKKYIDVLLKAILAGVLIGLAGTIYLVLKAENAVLGAFLFGFGLLTIVTFDFKLYTGRIAYVIDQKPSYLIEILVIILGNVIGTALIAGTVYISNMTSIIETAEQMTVFKLNNNMLSMFGLSILCGMMMYLGVEGYKRVKNDVARVVLCILAVVIFILGGFEHSIANSYYFVLANMWSWHMILSFVVMLIGNAAGAILLNGLEKVTKTK